MKIEEAMDNLRNFHVKALGTILNMEDLHNTYWVVSSRKIDYRHNPLAADIVASDHDLARAMQKLLAKLEEMREGGYDFEAVWGPKGKNTTQISV